MSVMLTILVIGQVIAVGADADQPVREAEKNWAIAVIVKDISAFDEMYSDDLIYAPFNRCD